MRFDGWSGGWPSYQDTKNRCWPTERCSESMLRACKMSTNWPRWPVSLMVMVHVCCEWAVSPQCVPLPASLTGYIWTCFLTARKVKDEKLGQRCSSPLRWHEHASVILMLSGVYWGDPGDLVVLSTQQSWTTAQFLRLSYVTRAFCPAPVIMSQQLAGKRRGRSGGPEVSCEVTGDANKEGLKDSGSSLLDLKVEHPKHLAEKMLAMYVSANMRYVQTLHLICCNSTFL